MDWEQAYKKMTVRNWVILLILGCLSFFLAEGAFTLGVILGGLIIIANFNVLQHTIRRAFFMDGIMMSRKKSIILKYYLRLAVMGFVIYILLAKSWVDPIGLVIGLSTVVISVVAIGIHMVLKQSGTEII